MLWFKKTILTAIIYFIGLGAGKQFKTFYESKNFTLSRNLSWSFNPSSIVDVEPPTYENDKYTYIECDESNENELKFSCKVVIDNYNFNLTSTSKKCDFTFDKEVGNEIINAVQLKSLANGKIIISYSIKTVETVTTYQNEFDYIRESELSTVNVYVINMRKCEALKSNVNFNAQNPANFIIVPVRNNFEIIAYSKDLRKCEKNLCIFKFDSATGKQIEAPIPMLLDKLYTDIAWQLNFYLLDTQSLENNYLVIARYTLDDSLSKVFIVKPDGIKNSPRAIFNYIQTDMLTNSYHWYKYHNSLLICAYKFTKRVISCSVIDDNLHIKSSVNFKLDNSTSLRSVFMSHTGKIVISAVDAVKKTHSYHKLYISSDNLLNKKLSVFEFTEVICYPRTTYYNSILSDIYENKNEICISNYCNNWSVKCISK